MHSSPAAAAPDVRWFDRSNPIAALPMRLPRYCLSEPITLEFRVEGEFFVIFDLTNPRESNFNYNGWQSVTVRRAEREVPSPEHRGASSPVDLSEELHLSDQDAATHPTARYEELPLPDLSPGQ